MTWPFFCRGQHSSTLPHLPHLMDIREACRERGCVSGCVSKWRSAGEQLKPSWQHLTPPVPSLVWFDLNQPVPCHGKLGVHSGHSTGPRKQPAQVKGVQQWGHRLFHVFLSLDQTPFTGIFSALQSYQALSVPDMWPPRLIPHRP